METCFLPGDVFLPGGMGGGKRPVITACPDSRKVNVVFQKYKLKSGIMDLRTKGRLYLGHLSIATYRLPRLW